MKKIIRIFAILLLLTMMACVYGQSITPVKENLYCIRAVVDLASQANPVMTELARQCCPAGYKVISQNQSVNPWGEYVLMWHISCKGDKGW